MQGGKVETDTRAKETWTGRRDSLAWRHSAEQAGQRRPSFYQRQRRSSPRLALPRVESLALAPQQLTA